MNATVSNSTVFTVETLANGKFCIRQGETILRKQSARNFPNAYVYGNSGWTRLAPDGQLRRLYGEPTVYPILPR